MVYSIADAKIQNVRGVGGAVGGNFRIVMNKNRGGE